MNGVYYSFNRTLLLSFPYFSCNFRLLQIIEDFGLLVLHPGSGSVTFSSDLVSVSVVNTNTPVKDQIQYMHNVKVDKVFQQP